MRVNPDNRPALLDSLQRLSDDEGLVLRQIGSGRKIQLPSDDPSGMAAIVQLQGVDEATQQYVQNISSIRTQMQASDSALSSAVVALERALSLAVRGANGTLSESDRNSIALELEGISDQLLEIANSTLQGNFLFAGTATDMKPFILNAGIISYSGNNATNQVQIGDGLWIRAGLAGADIFGSDANSAFGALQELTTALRNGEDVTAALNSVSAARNQVSASRVTYGNTLNQLASAELVMKQRHLQFAQQETDLAGADLAEAASQLATVETARNALLATIARINGPSLFDYLARG